jgi:type II secretory pathway pseudopilin PulG
MSVRTESPRRRGTALLIAVAISAIVGVCVLALWRSAAGARRADTLERAIVAAATQADSARTLAFALLDTGAWRGLPRPGDTTTLASGTTPRGRWQTEIARLGWQTVLVRGSATVKSGVPKVEARADERTLVPLQMPLPMPHSAITGANAWIVDPTATVGLAGATGPELRCRPAGHVVATTGQAPFPAGLDPLRYPGVDPDTVRDTLVGVHRLTRSHLTRPLDVEGMLVLDSELLLGADLRLTGVLVARGSIRNLGGRLTVTGAVISGDSGGGHSGLGPGDQVRYDACAIRRAVERVTRLGPSSTWTHLSLF